MSDNEIDIQCKKIADGLKVTKNLLSHDLANTVFELNSNLSTGRNYDQLIRLERSLLHYIERKGDLLYIGFIGNFSSGKSSTINSLLNLWSTNDERKVDQNPTDRDITLITHKKNKHSLIALKGEGALPIRTDFFELELLKNVCYADTPGTGDPLLLNEMVRDFLPVCDLIMYFFSAANPFNESDIPFLEKKHVKLPFVPIKFIITRADEFKIDRNKPLSPQNYDREQTTIFIAELTSRIGKILSGTQYKSDDFFIIDNKVGFGIKELDDFLRQQADVQNSNKRIAMHSHKVNYFLTNSIGIQKFFCSFLEEKVAVLEKIVNNAKSIIADYHENVQITNNELTKNWLEYSSKVEDIRFDLSKKLSKSRDEIYLPDNPWDIQELSEWQIKNTKEINSIAEQQANEIVQTTTSHTSAQLMDYLKSFKTKVSELDISKIRFVDLVDHLIQIKIDRSKNQLFNTRCLA